MPRDLFSGDLHGTDKSGHFDTANAVGLLASAYQMLCIWDFFELMTLGGATRHKMASSQERAGSLMPRHHSRDGKFSTSRG
jgi:hypothetical protein